MHTTITADTATITAYEWQFVSMACWSLESGRSSRFTSRSETKNETTTTWSYCCCLMCSLYCVAMSCQLYAAITARFLCRRHYIYVCVRYICFGAMDCAIDQRVYIYICVCVCSYCLCAIVLCKKVYVIVDSLSSSIITFTSIFSVSIARLSTTFLFFHSLSLTLNCHPLSISVFDDVRQRCT